MADEPITLDRGQSDFFTVECSLYAAPKACERMRVRLEVVGGPDLGSARVDYEEFEAGGTFRLSRRARAKLPRGRRLLRIRATPTTRGRSGPVRGERTIVEFRIVRNRR